MLRNEHDLDCRTHNESRAALSDEAEVVVVSSHNNSSAPAGPSAPALAVHLSAWGTLYSVGATCVLFAIILLVAGLPPTYIATNKGRKLYVSVIIPVLAVAATVLHFFMLEYPLRMLNAFLYDTTVEADRHRAAVEAVASHDHDTARGLYPGEESTTPGLNLDKEISWTNKQLQFLERLHRMPLHPLLHTEHKTLHNFLASLIALQRAHFVALKRQSAEVPYATSVPRHRAAMTSQSDRVLTTTRVSRTASVRDGPRVVPKPSAPLPDALVGTVDDSRVDPSVAISNRTAVDVRAEPAVVVVNAAALNGRPAPGTTGPALHTATDLSDPDEVSGTAYVSTQRSRATSAEPVVSTPQHDAQVSVPIPAERSNVLSVPQEPLPAATEQTPHDADVTRHVDPHHPIRRPLRSPEGVPTIDLHRGDRFAGDTANTFFYVVVTPEAVLVRHAALGVRVFAFEASVGIVQDAAAVSPRFAIVPAASRDAAPRIGRPYQLFVSGAQTAPRWTTESERALVDFVWCTEEDTTAVPSLSDLSSLAVRVGQDGGEVSAANVGPGARLDGADVLSEIDLAQLKRHGSVDRLTDAESYIVSWAVLPNRPMRLTFLVVNLHESSADELRGTKTTVCRRAVPVIECMVASVYCVLVSARVMTNEAGDEVRSLELTGICIENSSLSQSDTDSYSAPSQASARSVQVGKVVTERRVRGPKAPQ